jgi:thymidylate synthase (FAD)
MKELKYVKKVDQEDNLFGDGIANVSLWDFSRANLNEDSRIEAITQVASVCYANPNVVGKESLYNRLMAESIGLPSSSFEFVPMLISGSLIDLGFPYRQPNMWKYGELVVDGDNKYLLTNFRAALYDKEFGGTDYTTYFNTESECEIISKYFKVFLSKLDMVTRTQYIRHRVNWQELSRRYVSGKKVDFEFYVSEGMKNIVTDTYDPELEAGDSYDTQELISLCVQHYFNALDAGIQPQEARRILPQACYTTVWSAWQPKQLKNFTNLRSDKHAQWEIRQLSDAKIRLLA